MDHLTIANFKFGLDTRRSELTSQPGTLVTAENGHINQGAQFEKRKAFVLLGTLPAGTFGLQETPSGLVTFGSAASAVVPAGLLGLVTYQRLRHWLWAIDAVAPGIASHINPNTAAEPVMSAIVYSCSFGSRAFAIASFSEEASGGTDVFDDLLPTTNCYYSGSPVVSSFQGLMPLSKVSALTGLAGSNQTLAYILTYISQFYIGSSFSVTYNTQLQAGGGTYYGVLFTGPLTSSFALQQSDTCGKVVKQFVITKAAPPVTAVGSSVIIYITSGAAGSISVLTAPNVINGAISGTLNLIPSGAVAFNTSLYQTALDVANAVNKSNTGYSAQAQLITVTVASLTITAPLNFGAVPNTNNLGITSTTLKVSSSPSLGSGFTGAQTFAFQSNGVAASAGNGQISLVQFNPTLFLNPPNIAQGTYTLDLVFNNSFTSLGAGYLTRKRPTFFFYLVSGGSGSIDSISVPGIANLLSAAVPFNINLARTSIDVASNINALWGGAGAHPTNPGSWAAYPITFQDDAVSSTLDVYGVMIVGPTSSGESLNGVNNVVVTSTIIGCAHLATDVGMTSLILSLDGGNYDPTCATSLGGKLYLGRGSYINFCASYDASRWEQQDIGAGFIRNTDQDTAPTGTVSLCPYQGKLAAFSRRNISIWNVNADPAQYSIAQNLKNIGTMAALSVQAIGELDTLFLSDTGIRSLRTRDTTLNAYVVDVGSPVDDLIQTDLLSGNGPSACSIVEPSSNRYWLYLNGTIYVMSYFPSLKIIAWSTYLPTYDDGAGNQVTFTPSKFLVYNGQVYVYTTDRKVIVYGGANNNTYDGCIATIELPWLDAKSPFVIKQGEAVNVAMAGKWNVFCSLDPRGNSLIQVVPNAATGTGNEQLDSTFDEGVFGFSQQGTHYKFKAQTTIDWKQAANVSSFTLQYSKGQNE